MPHPTAPIIQSPAEYRDDVPKKRGPDQESPFAFLFLFDWRLGLRSCLGRLCQQILECFAR